MDIAVETLGQAGLTVWGVDRVLLKGYVDDETARRGTLPATQDTFTEVNAVESASHTLTVSVWSPSPQGNQPEPLAIELIPPSREEAWTEGFTYSIVLTQEGVNTTDIAVASGGKPFELFPRRRCRLGAAPVGRHGRLDQPPWVGAIAFNAGEDLEKRRCRLPR